MSVSTTTTRTRRAAGALAATAALLLGTAAGASAASLTAGPQVHQAVHAWTDPWSPEPVVGDLFDASSQGWSGTVPVGTTTSTSMTITAKQDLVLRPGNWYSGSEYFDFALSGTCPSSLFGSARMAPGDTCTVTWTIHPVDLSGVAAGWSFYATPVDAGGTATGEQVLGQHNIQFSSSVVVTEDVDFGLVTVGTSETRPVTFRNVSAVDALLSVDAPYSPVVMPDRPLEPVLVPAGESLTLDAVYTPTWASTLMSSAWFSTTLPGSESRSTGIVRFSGSGVDAVVDPTEPPVDPTEPPVEPVEPPVEPVEPPVEPVEPPVEPPVDPAGPTTPLVDPTDESLVQPAVPVGERTSPAGTPGAAAATSAASSSDRPGAEQADDSPGELASTGARWTSLVLGALTLLSAGVALRLWSRARSARDGARSAF